MVDAEEVDARQTHAGDLPSCAPLEHAVGMTVAAVPGDVAVEGDLAACDRKTQEADEVERDHGRARCHEGHADDVPADPFPHEVFLGFADCANLPRAVQRRADDDGDREATVYRP